MVVLSLYTPIGKLFQLIIGNPKSKSLASFDFDIMYTKGSDNLSDFLLRYPCQETENKHKMSLAEQQYLNFLTMHVFPKSTTIHEILENA